jgi:hypothetical protein
MLPDILDQFTHARPEPDLGPMTAAARQDDLARGGVA